ncbi:tyrosine-type recombinase/integrase [Bernardetia sp. Wsw4-3y2]|uniref:tyrosine-type recombinase/integrase n=1 Tax=Bernardetia sp. Wsw4-3y2 TaxID=3127471 RepID=UPI0030CDA547
MRLKIWFFIRNNSITCKLSSTNQKRVEFVTGMRCTPENWDKQKERTKNNTADNARITELRALFEQRHEELLILQKHNPHTLRQLFNEVWKNKETAYTSFLVLIQEWQDYLESRVGTDLEYSTFKSYKSKLNNIRDFVTFTKTKYLNANSWNDGIAMELESYIKKYKGGHNHAEKVLSQLREVFKFGKKKKYIVSVPVEHSIKRLPVDLVYLTAKEIKRFADVDISKQAPHVQKAKDGFLLQCYTGVAFAELTRITKDTIFETPKLEWKEWILIKRKKTKKRKLKPCIIPVLPEAKKILEKYNYKIPKFENGNYNLAIACICTLAKIKKDISSHNGRKSFGNYLSELGISNESISKMYGHSNTQITENSYVEIRQTRIAREINQVFGKKE